MFFLHHRRFGLVLRCRTEHSLRRLQLIRRLGEEDRPVIEGKPRGLDLHHPMSRQDTCWWSAAKAGHGGSDIFSLWIGCLRHHGAGKRPLHGESLR